MDSDNDYSKFNIGDIVEYVHDTKMPQYADRDGSVGIIQSGPINLHTQSTRHNTDIFYQVAWVVVARPWESGGIFFGEWLLRRLNGGEGEVSHGE
jgi:hypothetical protein